jgi:hypothetical protein
MGSFVAVDIAVQLDLWQGKMPQHKKTIDTVRRKAKQPKSPQPRHGKTYGRIHGRPGIDQDSLLNDRNKLLEVLSTGWHRIGWRLSRVRSLESLRKALRPLKRNSSIDFWIMYLLREKTSEATSADIRATRKVLGEMTELLQSIGDRSQLLTRQYDLVDAAVNSDKVDVREEVWREHRRRGDEFEQCERQLFAVKCRLDDIEERLADQWAYFAQTQLFAFVNRGYAHNPLVLANALAGLPSIGCRRSFELCSRQKSPQGPSLRYQIFKTIEAMWEQRERASTNSLVDQFRSAILKRPQVVSAQDARGHGPAKKGLAGRENYVREFLCDNWRYLKKAVERLHLSKLHSGAVPYVIVSRLYANIGMPRTSEEQLLAEIEMIKE